MGKPVYDPPTPAFPHKILRRFNLLSTPKKYVIDTGEGMPAFTPRGIRVSATRSRGRDRVNDAAWPYIRKFLILKRLYKNQFTPERLERVDRMLEAANATCYSKLANCVLDLKNQGGKDLKKKRGWTESDWKKHMDYINHLADPKKDFRADSVMRGPCKPLQQLLPRINQICYLPEFKVYRRLSKEEWYRDPIKVPPNALKYVITDRVKKLATPKVIPQPTSFD